MKALNKSRLKLFSIISMVIMVLIITLISGCNKPEIENDTKSTMTIYPAGSIALYLDNSLADTKYELGSKIQIKVVSDPTTEVCIDVLDNLYGINYSCGDTDGAGNYYVNITLPTVSVNTFNDSISSKILNSAILGFLNVNNKSIYEHFSATVKGTGSFNNSIMFNNDEDTRIYLPGYLYEDTLESRNWSDNVNNITFLLSQFAILKYVPLPDNNNIAVEILIDLIGEIYYFQYTEDFSTTDFKDSDNTDAIWNTTQSKGHMRVNYYNQSKSVRTGEVTQADGCSINPESPETGTQRFNNLKSIFDDRDTTFGEWQRYRFNVQSYGQGCREYVFAAWNITPNTQTELKYYLRAYLTKGNSLDRTITELQIYDFTASTWETIDKVGGTIGELGEPFDSQTADPKTLSFTIENKHIRSADNYTEYRILSTRRKQTTVSTNWNTTAKLYSGFHGNEEFDTIMPSVLDAIAQPIPDDRQIITSSSLYTPPTDITSIRINITAETLPPVQDIGTNFTFYLTADGGTNWEVIPTYNTIYNHTFSNTGKDLRWRAILFTENDRISPNITKIDFPDEIGSTYPSNIYIDIGNDGIVEYNMTGDVSTLSLNLTNVSIESINSYLSSPDEEDILLLPVIFYSDTRGVLVSTINFSVTGANDISIQDVNVTCTTSSCNVPINVSSSSINLSNIALSYYGHKNVTITAHDSDSSVTDSSLAILYYSGWGYTLASDYFEFIPERYNSKNVSAYGQNSNTPIFNLTSQNYDRNMNLSIYLNSSESGNCVNLSYNTNSNKSSSTQITAGIWYNIFNNKQSGYNQGVWMWADYNCAYTAWGYYEPGISIRGCVIDGICDMET